MCCTGANPNLNLDPYVEETTLGYYTEEQFKEIPLKNLEYIYNKLVLKLVSLG